jgi:hypothetical protein
MQVEKVMRSYVHAYEKLYRRTPADLRAIDHEWVIVNGARMRLAELEFLTTQQYEQAIGAKRSMIARLIGWFKT